MRADEVASNVYHALPRSGSKRTSMQISPVHPAATTSGSRSGTNPCWNEVGCV